MFSKERERQLFRPPRFLASFLQREVRLSRVLTFRKVVFEASFLHAFCSGFAYGSFELADTPLQGTRDWSASQVAWLTDSSFFRIILITGRGKQGIYWLKAAEEAGQESCQQMARKPSRRPLALPASCSFSPSENCRIFRLLLEAK